jgi:hypothetical protein
MCIYLKQRCLFSKTKDKKVKRVLSGDWCQWEWAKYRKREKISEYGENIMVLYMNMEK